MVMGHQNCGAVAAALNNEDTGLHLDALLAHIRPAIADVDENPSQDLNLCAKRNALNSIKRLEECELTLGELGREQIRYQAAFYYLDEGRVELLTPLPRP
jgi:carbonic anhydrase